MRLNRYLALTGLGSRRACEDIILSGAVTINGECCTELATQVGDDDQVHVDGKHLQLPKYEVLAMNKPRGVLCTSSDECGRRTVFEFLPPGQQRLFTVGRLDMDSEGLLLLTNHGALAEQLSRPASHVEKEYAVTLNKDFVAADTAKLLKGFYIRSDELRGRGRMAMAVAVNWRGGAQVNVTLMQGIKRQIRLMFSFLGYKVRHLKRVRIGGLHLGKLKPGEWRSLSSREQQKLLTPQRRRDPVKRRLDRFDQA